MLLILPVLIAVSSFRSIDKRDKDWYGADYDPSYAYLYNALNMARFRQVGHFDHPGTPMQVIGGVVLQVAWMVKPFGGNTLTEAVLKEPEHYLGILNRSVAVLGALTVLIAGLVTRLFTRNIGYALVVQAAPFISGIILYNSFIRISQESVLMMASLAMAVCLLYGYFKQSVQVKWLSIISAFGLASKVIFMPLMLLPMLLVESKKLRLEYLKRTVLYFLVFTLPIILLYPRMGWWFIRLFIYSGTYGSGEMNIVDAGSYIHNLTGLLTGQPVYFILYLTTFAAFIVLALIRLFRNLCYDKPATKLLFGIFLVQTIGFLITAKHPKLAYLLPYQIIAVTAAVILIRLIVDALQKASKAPASSVSVASFTGLIMCLGIVMILLKNGLNEKEFLQAGDYNLQYKEAWQTALKAADGGAVIGINPGPSPIAAMFFGNVYTRDRYSRQLQHLYPNFYIFDSYGKQLINFNYDTLNLAMLSQKHGKIVITGSDVDAEIPHLASAIDGIRFEKLYEGKAEVMMVSVPEADSGDHLNKRTK